MSHHLVGLTEIAAMLGVSRQRAAQIAGSYDDFPPPEAELAAGRIWSRTAVEAWIRSHPQRPSGRSQEVRVSASSGPIGRLSDRGRKAIVHAQQEARLLNHNYIGTEHLLLGLLATEGVAAQALASFGVTADVVRADVERMIGRGKTAPGGHIPFTPRSKAVMQLACDQADGLGANNVSTEHLLLGIVAEGMGEGGGFLAKRRAKEDKLGVAARILADNGVPLTEVREAVLNAVGTPPEPVVDQLERLEQRLEAIERRLAEG